jgi:aminoglycoside phosphotransferase (APT) family kinase protein
MNQLRHALLEMLAGAGVREITEPTRLGGGSSQENWAFDAKVHHARDGRRWPLLMRREPEGGVVDTARDVEFALLRALGHTDLPVPRVYAFDDGRRLGRPAMIVDRLSGQAHRGVLRPADPLRLGETGRQQLAEALPQLLARVHRLDVRELGLFDILPDPSQDPARTELERWVAELNAAELEPQPAARAVIDWLKRHLPPPPERITLVHGDFRPANVLVNDGHVSALLDWELAHLGDPHDDLGWYTCSVYRREHFRAGRWELDDFLREWSQTAAIAVDPERLRFWQVMSTFRLAVIALRGVQAFCTGVTDRPSAPADRVIALALRDTGLMTCGRHSGMAR